MPKLYEYYGLIVFFYANDHEPIHVHGRYEGRESKAEIVLKDGKIIGIKILDVAGKRSLAGSKLADFKRLIHQKAPDIIAKWIDFYVRNRRIESETITHQLR